MTDIVDELRARALQGRFNLEAADEIERLRAELSEQCRLLGMSGEREAKHLAQIAALEKERDALRARIEAMEKQVPICRAEDLRHAEILLPSLGLMPEDKLYALPGAQPAPSVPEVTDAMALAFHHALTDGSIGAREVEEIKDALRAALAAAPKLEGE